VAQTITLYARPACHLCDEARAVIAELTGPGSAIELREIDIDGDDRLLAAYLERIPVIEVDGVEVSELVPDRDALKRALHTVQS
jgi:glutaredoxin